MGFGNIEHQSKKQQNVIVDSTIIDPYALDSSKIKFKYNFWEKFNFTNWHRFAGNMQFGDYNKNGKTEIFVYRSEPHQMIGPVAIYEIESTKSVQLLFTYPDSVVYPVAQYDIDNDGREDIILNTDGSRGIFVYSSANVNSLPTVQKLFFSYSPNNQVNDIMFDDFDGNGKTDLLFTANIDTGE